MKSLWLSKKVIVPALMLSVMTVSCSSPAYVTSESEQIIPVAPGDVLTDDRGDEIITFDAVIISQARYIHLLRCESYVATRGIIP